MIAHREYGREEEGKELGWEFSEHIPSKVRSFDFLRWFQLYVVSLLYVI